MQSAPFSLKFIHRMRKVIKICLLGAILSFCLGCGEKKIDFSAQVKPILNKRCISCHGGVKRNAEYSLLFRHEALDTAESGKIPIIPGEPHNSPGSKMSQPNYSPNCRWHLVAQVIVSAAQIKSPSFSRSSSSTTIMTFPFLMSSIASSMVFNLIFIVSNILRPVVRRLL